MDPFGHLRNNFQVQLLEVNCIYIVRCYSNDSRETIVEQCVSPVVIQLHYFIWGLKGVVWKSVQQSGCGRVKLLVGYLIINRVLRLVSYVILTS